jgi:CRP-like cAMP-binding protein
VVSGRIIRSAFPGQSQPRLAGHTVRTATATTVEDSSLLRIDKDAMIQVLHEKPEFAQLFMAYLLTHTMIGTTRSCVSFFMNKFRKLGFIDYNGEMHVHSSLLNVVLHDWGSHTITVILLLLPRCYHDRKDQPV